MREVDRVHHGGSDDPNVLDFSANSNPEVPDGARTVYEDAFDGSRRYPPDGAPEFCAAAAEYLGCERDQVVPTSGGLAAIRLAMRTLLEAGDEVLVPAPSFSEYVREARLAGADPTFVAHDGILDADPTDAAMAVVCTPNNPTGEAADPEALRRFADRCRGADTTLLVDEAFLGFTDEPTLAGRPGVVVARSLTKLFGLPGLRAGFVVATGERRDALERGRIAWSLGTPAAAVGAHCMAQTEFVERTRERVASERARLRDRLGARYDVFPSDAPFLLLDVEDVDPVLARASDHGVAVRDARTFRGLDSHVRVAVRLPEENDRLLEALDA
jgi:histidinol-phosphate aminotransferase/threonine-phosphate decarboxylase